MVDVKKLEQELSELPQGWIVLLETKAEDAFDAGVAAVKILTDKKYNGVIVSASRPYKNLLDHYAQKGVDVDDLFILDCICKKHGDTEDLDNVLHLEDASALTDISIAIDESIKQIGDKAFLFIDSITALLIHNDPAVFVRFIHHLLTRMRVNGLNGLVLSLEEGRNSEIRAEIVQLCDKVIKV
jgi:KaiC/GvpD/RAD55 family RecA-like ATPase